MQNEMPAVGHSTYSASAVNLNQAVGSSVGYLEQQNLNQAMQAGQQRYSADYVARHIHQALPTPKEEPPMPATTRRLVQVFIVDPQEAVPIKDCLLYKGELQLTDLTDQELFYELDIKQMLDAHNEKRAKIVDKKVKERTEFLEPARIRDLRMQIVTVAQF
jgi:hypothetical protein